MKGAKKYITSWPNTLFKLWNISLLILCMMELSAGVEDDGGRTVYVNPPHWVREIGFYPFLLLVISFLYVKSKKDPSE